MWLRVELCRESKFVKKGSPLFELPTLLPTDGAYYFCILLFIINSLSFSIIIILHIYLTPSISGSLKCDSACEGDTDKFLTFPWIFLYFFSFHGFSSLVGDCDLSLMSWARLALVFVSFTCLWRSSSYFHNPLLCFFKHPVSTNLQSSVSVGYGSPFQTGVTSDLWNSHEVSEVTHIWNYCFCRWEGRTTFCPSIF